MDETLKNKRYYYKNTLLEATLLVILNLQYEIL